MKTEVHLDRPHEIQQEIIMADISKEVITKVPSSSMWLVGPRVWYVASIV